MSKVTRYSYLLDFYPDPETHSLKEIYRPMINIRISKDNKQISFPFDALIDSGADRSLFPMSLAIEIGLVFDHQKPREIYGIGGKILAYSTKIFIKIDMKKYSTEAYFSSQQELPLLGRNGFFNLFKSVKFDEKGKVFYIEE